MSTRKKFKPLAYGNIRIKASRVHLFLDAFVILAAALAIMVAALPFWLQNLMVITLMVVLGFRCHQWRSQKLQRLVYCKQQWLLQADLAKTEKPGRLLRDCYYWSRWLVVVRLENSGGKRFLNCHIPVFFDACHREDFRRLKIITRYFLD